MQTAYAVVRPYFDRFAGMNIYVGCTVTLRPGSRTIAWGGKSGEPLTNDLHSPTDEDFAFVTGEYEKLAKAGVMAVAAMATKQPAPKQVADKQAAPPDAPKSDAPKADAGKKAGK
ncbi:MAG: hypothetical protein KGL39_16250 [Patescibacteria group bacterium]|nr:hypothetical protein [Patescibacteria group bacterium]